MKVQVYIGQRIQVDGAEACAGAGAIRRRDVTVEIGRVLVSISDGQARARVAVRAAESGRRMLFGWRAVVCNATTPLTLLRIPPTYDSYTAIGTYSKFKS